MLLRVTTSLQKQGGASLWSCRRCSRFGSRLQSSTATATTAEKYAKKIQQLAQQKGQSVEELKAEARQSWREQTLKQTRSLQKQHSSLFMSGNPSEQQTEKQPASPPPERQDSSPVRPLSHILNLPKLFSTPHTPEQISSLWIAYHSSKQGGGLLSASLPLAAYNKMAATAAKYPSLVVPLPRPKTPVDSSDPTTSTDASDLQQTPYEFYFLEWAFHHTPPSSSTSANPSISTVFFTPLQEYKLRTTYATPYLVLSHYTDLASSHGIVLLRGELTPSPSSSSSSYLIGQPEAQYLAMLLQKFYLWDGDEQGDGPQRLLKQFHESPADFRWEDLIKYSAI